jgi:hypothetical protein
MVNRLTLLRSRLIPLGHLIERASLGLHPFRGNDASNRTVALMWDSLNLTATYLMNPRNQIDGAKWEAVLGELIGQLASARPLLKQRIGTPFATQVARVATNAFPSKLYPLIGYSPAKREKWLCAQQTALQACPYYPFIKGIKCWRTLVRNTRASDLGEEYKALKIPLAHVARVQEFASRVGTEKLPALWQMLARHLEEDSMAGQANAADAPEMAVNLLKPGVQVAVQPNGTMLVTAKRERLAVIKSKSPAVKGKSLPKAIQELMASPSQGFYCVYTELPETIEKAHAWLEIPTDNDGIQRVYDTWVLEQEKVWTMRELKKHFSEEQIELIRKSLVE